MRGEFLRVLTNERRVLRVLTNERSVLPDDDPALGEVGDGEVIHEAAAVPGPGGDGAAASVHTVLSVPPVNITFKASDWSAKP